MNRFPLSLQSYRASMVALEPVAALALRFRAARGKEDLERLAERRGYSTALRPEGPLVWVHGASIGETLTLLPLIERLTRRGFFVLVTSGTVTSALLLVRRLPAGTLHQYVPLDVPRYLRRFLDYWQPDLVIFAESELWPVTVSEIGIRGIPLCLVNARLSERAFRRWSHAPLFAKALMGQFSLCLAQSQEDAERLARLGAPHVLVAGNMKYDVPPPPVDPHLLASLSGMVAGRPIWLAASTHPGEEDIIAAVHVALMRRFPDLLTILAPRHPRRASQICALLADHGLDVARRSRGERPDRDIPCYLADTVGELGLFYRLAPLAFIGGSLIEHGGQNPIEPARLGCAILHGPHIHNFTPVYAALDQGGGARQVEDVIDLVGQIGRLLQEGNTLRAMARSALETVNMLGGALERTLTSLEPFLLALQLKGR
jgi:3-deoxy-D-manno-octulosonic-acid transferase